MSYLCERIGRLYVGSNSFVKKLNSLASFFACFGDAPLRRTDLCSYWHRLCSLSAMTSNNDLTANTLDLVTLTKRYSDTVTAVDNINLRILANHYRCLLGPSGCGKSDLSGHAD